MASHFKVAGNTNVGLVRKGNEDNFLIDEENQVFVVCDGMGGHQAGEVASMMACDMIQTVYNDFADRIFNDPTLKIDRAFPISGDILVKSIRLANRIIHNRASENESLKGMGTTVVALALENNMLSVAHVGDSRAYRIDERELTPLTNDHSWVAEMQQMQNITEDEASNVFGKNVITRALGVRENVEVDYRLTKVKAGDKFLLCSDGLCGFADDDDIFNVIAKVRDENEKIVEDLIQMANDRGGSDNVTIVVLEILEAVESGLPEVEKVTLTVETSQQLESADKWIDKINQFIAGKDKQQEIIDSEPKKSSMILIFALFVVVAAVIIFFASR